MIEDGSDTDILGLVFAGRRVDVLLSTGEEENFICLIGDGLVSRVEDNDAADVVSTARECCKVV